jgi:hypothetical protein
MGLLYRLSLSELPLQPDAWHRACNPMLGIGRKSTLPGVLHYLVILTDIG